MRYWQRKGKAASDAPDDRARRIFEIGHLFHEWFQDMLDKKGLLIEREMEVEDLHRRGHIDAIIHSDNRFVLYDFKTVNSMKFKYLKTDSDKHYQHQVCTYALMLPLGVEEARIAYISKDTMEIHEVKVDIDALRDEVIEDWIVLIEAWERQVEPKPNPLSWECSYCVYGSSCTYCTGL